jgi:O-antigen biosynthesis alpha-1,2-mannosyltransferase
MKICLDLRTASNGRHGIARYGIELSRALQALGTSHRLILLTRQGNEPECLWQTSALVLRCPARPYSLEEQLLVPFADVYHCPTYVYPLFVPVPTVFNVHDLLPLEYPRDFSPGLRLYYLSLVRCMAKRACRIVTPSSYTLASICRRLSLASDKVRVISEGGDHVKQRRFSDEDERHYHEINPGDRDYFLSVANPRPHKNILFAIRSMLNSQALRQREMRYVLVGQQHPSVYAYAQARDGEGRIRFAGKVTEGLLWILYERATALLCPSRGEGFCFPVVEAMQFGLPVIASDDGALPEVLGQAGLLLSPDSTQAWQEACERIHASRREGTWDASPVLERAALFSWAKAAAQTMALYEEVYEESRKPSKALRNR